MKRLFPVICVFSCLIAAHSFAGSATWNMNPISGDWNTAGNWTPEAVPDEVATFGVSNTTSISVSDPSTSIGEIVFAPGASAFTIKPMAGASLLISGAGVSNSSGIAQNFMLDAENAQIIFSGSAVVPGLTTFTTSEPGLQFEDDSLVENVVIENLAETAQNRGGFVVFSGRASGSERMRHATIHNYGAESGSARGGWAYFADEANAGQALITCEGATVSEALGGLVQFAGNSNAGNANLVANAGFGGGGGGLIQFLAESVGGLCRVHLSGDGQLDISQMTAEGVRVGFLESKSGVGNGVVGGTVVLGNKKLTVGANNLTTLFYGQITDGPSASGGSLRKVGSGNLHLISANTYTGGTVIEEGSINAGRSSSGSSTGSGPVQVNGGALAGDGVVGGSVTIGGLGTTGAYLEPNYTHDQGTNSLTIEGALTLAANSIYHVHYFGTGGNDTVDADGITIDASAQIELIPSDPRMSTVGKVFTLLNNTSDTPISGTFANMPDGAIFFQRGNTLEVSYEGGDGNDLTLTVLKTRVPE